MSTFFVKQCVEENRREYNNLSLMQKVKLKKSDKLLPYHRSNYKTIRKNWEIRTQLRQIN